MPTWASCWTWCATRLAIVKGEKRRNSPREPSNRWWKSSVRKQKNSTRSSQRSLQTEFSRRSASQFKELWMEGYRYANAKAFPMWSMLGCGAGPISRRWKWNISISVDMATIWNTKVYVSIRTTTSGYVLPQVRSFEFCRSRLMGWCHAGKKHVRCRCARTLYICLL